MVAYIIAPDGRIVNSNKVKPSFTGVEKISTMAVPVEISYYSLDGLKVNKSSKGIYIEKTLMSDGKVNVKKVNLR